ncbi:tetratricopeptide repeat protein [Tenacibaculum sp.]|uniref:tetratricopeptide repeat protein n=1 Tax=Tenacibaculum sp. TaxID=1906242 RepID=UPI003D12B1D9
MINKNFLTILCFSLCLIFSCKKPEKVRNIEPLNTKNEKQELLPSFKIDFKSGNNNILKIKLNDKVINDTIKNPLIADVSVTSLSDSIYKLKFQYGVGKTIEICNYLLNLNSKSIIKRTSYSADSNEANVSNGGLNYPIDKNFSSDFLYDLNYVNGKSVYFAFELNSNKENGYADLRPYFNLVEKLFKAKDIDKLKLACDIEVIDVVNQYCPVYNKNYLTMFNDIGYFLEQSGLYEESVYILEVIIKEFPNRTVAYINLGDAYWGLGKKEEAKQVYKVYVEQMKAKNKERKIPSQVLERIKE